MWPRLPRAPEFVIVRRLGLRHFQFAQTLLQATCAEVSGGFSLMWESSVPSVFCQATEEIVTVLEIWL